MEFAVPNTEVLRVAHETFEKRESRYRDYWTAFEGVEKGLRGRDLRAVARSIAPFLKSWNKTYYQYRPTEAQSLSKVLEELITEHIQRIEKFRMRSLSTLIEDDRPAVISLFGSFERRLGPVGAAKALNVLAPHFFPLWDSDIALEYGVSTTPRGYFTFMAVAKCQVEKLKAPDGLIPLKVLDEYNFCKYTNRWLS